MGGFDRKLKRQAARKVMKENNIPTHLISEKVKQYTKMDNSATLENEKKSINYISLMKLLKLHYFDNQKWIETIDEFDSELVDDYREAKRVFHDANSRYDELINGMSKMEFYKNSLALMLSRNNSYFVLLKSFDLQLQIVFVLWMIDKLLVENTFVFNKALYDSKEMSRGDAYTVVSLINKYIDLDSDSEATIKAYMDKFINLDGANYSRHASIVIAKKYNSSILDTIKKLGLEKEEDKIIKFASELYNRALEISNTTRLFEDIYTINISINSLFLISYYLSIANTLDSKIKNITKPKILAMLKANSDITDADLSVVNSLMNYKANDKSLFIKKEVFYTNDNLLIMIFVVGLMALPIKDEIVEHVIDDIFGNNFRDQATVAIVRKDTLAEDVMNRYKIVVDNIIKTSDDVNNILDRTYYYTYKVEIDFLKESTKLMSVLDFENILKENKIYKKFKTLIEF